MHCNVNAAIKQGIINFLGEETFSTDVGERLVEDLVTSGLDDDDLEGAFLVQVGESRLRKIIFEKARLVGDQWYKICKERIEK